MANDRNYISRRIETGLSLPENRPGQHSIELNQSGAVEGFINRSIARTCRSDNHIGSLRRQFRGSPLSIGLGLSGTTWHPCRTMLPSFTNDPLAPYSISDTGFMIDARGGLGIGDAISLSLPAGEVVDAYVVGRAENGLRCRFASPLSPAQLGAARAGAQLVGKLEVSRIEALDDFGGQDRWPLPARAAIAVGGAAALWGLIALALR